jgi:hypothetical protein
MIETMNVIASILCFILFGVICASIYIKKYIIVPLEKMLKELLGVLESSNQTNQSLVKRIKDLNKSKIKNEDEEEKDFIIKALIKMQAKGWTYDDTLEELRDLYDLL